MSQTGFLNNNINDPEDFRPRCATKTRMIRRSAKSKRKPRKLVLIGASKSGKTALAKRFVDNTFSETYVETIEDIFQRDYSYHGFNLNLEIIDLPGAFQFPVMRDLHIKAADVILLVYEVNNMSSINEIKAVFPIIEELRPKVPLVLVGTKGDLKSSAESDDNEVMNMFNDFPIFKHTITSARLGMNVTEAFELGLDDVIVKIRTLSNSVQGMNPDSRDKKLLCCCCSCKVQ